MANPSYSRSLVSSVKRLRLSTPPTAAAAQQQTRTIKESSTHSAEISQPSKRNRPTRNPNAPNIAQELDNLRLPKAVQATYLAPLKRTPTHNITSCDLQLRSYSVRNLEILTDFALRSAYFLHLPAKGPMPLPRIVERWTVPRSNFAHKKSQENFERITLRRWIRIVDGHPDTVAIWLAFLRKHSYYGVGMKAQVWENGGLDVAADLEAEAEKIAVQLGEKLQLIGGKAEVVEDGKALEKRFLMEPFKGSWGAYAAMGGAQSVPNASEKIETVRVVGGGAGEP